MKYKNKYKSIQLNLLKDKHEALINWILFLSDKEEMSINSFIIRILKKEFEQWGKENIQ